MNVRDLKEEINILNKQIEEIQEHCSHPVACVDKVHKSNTGNYDPSCDHYWTDFKCHLCEKQWSEEGSK